MTDPIYPVSRIASSGAGGYTPGQIISANSNNAQCIKAGPGTLGYINGFNVTCDVTYLKFYDSATAPDPSTATPVLTFKIPNGSIPGELGPAIPPQGIEFVNGISLAIVDGPDVHNNVAVASGSTVVGFGIR